MGAINEMYSDLEGKVENYIGMNFSPKHFGRVIEKLNHSRIFG